MEHARQPTPRNAAFARIPITQEQIARVAGDTSNAIDVQQADAGTVQATVQASVRQLGSWVSAHLESCLNVLTGWFGAANTEVDAAERTAEVLEDALEEAEEAKRAAEKRLRETELQVQASGASRYPLLRTMPTPMYAILLLVASAAMGLVNTATFRVIGLPDTLTIVFAVLVAGVYGVAIHILPQGFRRGRRRDPRFWAASAVLVLQVASTILLSQMRGDYLTILEVSLEPWNIVALPLLADAVALLAAFIHGSEDASALRIAKRNQRHATRRFEEATEDYQTASTELHRKLQERFTMMETGLREIHAAQGPEAEAIFNSFFMHLLRLRPLPAGLLQSIDTTVGLPDNIRAYEGWLTEEAVRLARPSPFNGETGWGGLRGVEED